MWRLWRHSLKSAALFFDLLLCCHEGVDISNVSLSKWLCLGMSIYICCLDEFDVSWFALQSCRLHWWSASLDQPGQSQAQLFRSLFSELKEIPCCSGSLLLGIHWSFFLLAALDFALQVEAQTWTVAWHSMTFYGVPWSTCESQATFGSCRHCLALICSMLKNSELQSVVTICTTFRMYYKHEIDLWNRLKLPDLFGFLRFLVIIVFSHHCLQILHPHKHVEHPQKHSSDPAQKDSKIVTKALLQMQNICSRGSAQPYLLLWHPPPVVALQPRWINPSTARWGQHQRHQRHQRHRC